jgi:hypothetical protein
LQELRTGKQTDWQDPLTHSSPAAQHFPLQQPVGQSGSVAIGWQLPPVQALQGWQTAGTPAQLPSARHMSPVVQASPSLQGRPASTANPQVPAWVQTAVMHGSVVCLQSDALLQRQLRRPRASFGPQRPEQQFAFSIQD